MIGTTLHAIHAAITDCRNAGLDLESDPAFILLARHLGTVCAGQPSQAAWPLPTRYSGTAISISGEPIPNRVSNPTSRFLLSCNEELRSAAGRDSVGHSDYISVGDV